MSKSPTEEERLRHSAVHHSTGSTHAPDPHKGGKSEPKSKRRMFVTIAVLAVVVIGVVLIWNKTHAQAPGQGGRPGTSAGGGGGRGGGGGGRGGRSMTGPMPVVAQAAVTGDLDIYLNGLGTVTPLANVTIRTQISGVLMKVNFAEGQMVQKGDLLAVIDARPYQVSLEQAQGQLLQAQSQLKEAQVDLARYETLAQQDSIAKQQVDSQRALVSQYQGLVQTDEAAINSARLNITYCNITAPVTGRVGLRLVDAGNYVTPGDANGLVVLTQVKPITVLFTLPEDNVPSVAARIHAGSTIPVEAYDRALTRKLATGSLATIDNQVDTTTGTFRLRAQFDNSDESLFPNQFVNVKMLLDVDRGATIIPSSAIERGQQGTYVYVVTSKDGGATSTVNARPVTLGPVDGERVVIAKGLDVGEMVVVDGADKLKEDMQVVVQTPAAPGAGPASPKAPGAPGGKGGGRKKGKAPADGSASADAAGKD